MLLLVFFWSLLDLTYEFKFVNREEGAKSNAYQTNVISQQYGCIVHVDLRFLFINYI